MYIKQHLFVLSLLSVAMQSAFAEQVADSSVVDRLSPIELKADKTPSSLLDTTAGDHVLQQKQLIEGATTIGNALNGQSGEIGRAHV